ncbi:MAG: FAD-dependent oxidoreductase, partial [bacterium]|nr:FAD-dependent oxidoreductase [bacterium]
TLRASRELCVTLNHRKPIDPAKIHREIVYHHPVYTVGALDAQRELDTISGVNRTHFCGAYHGYGFHEDGVNSALAVGERFGESL